MLTRFTADLWQIAQTGGITMTDQTVSDALIAFAMQSYYEGANATDPTGIKQLFKAVTGGIEFAMSDIVTSGNVTDTKAYKQYIEPLFTHGVGVNNTIDQNFKGLSYDERQVILKALPAIHDWYVQAGLSGMYATDLNNVNDFMLGGTGNNLLSGGTGNDLLVAGQNGSDTLNGGAGNNTLIAGSGNDFLVGGQGNDTIYGGSGYDTFNFVAPNAGITTETIIAYATGTGMVEVGGAQLTGGGATQGKAQVWTDSKGDQYQYVASKANQYIGTLTITQGLLGSTGDQIVIQNFDLNAAQTNANGYLGIKLTEQLAIRADTNPVSPFASAATINPTATVPNGNAKTFTVYASATSSIAQTVQLNCSGSGQYAISTGANIINFDANGNATVTIPAGQDAVTLTLIDTSTTGAADTANLTASHIDASGKVTSNQLTVNFTNPDSGATTTAVPSGRTPLQLTYFTGLSPAVSPSNYLIQTSTVYTGTAGADLVLFQNSTPTNNIIVGNGGQDVWIFGDGNNQIYENTQVNCVFHANWTASPRQSGQSERSDAGVIVLL